MDEQLKAKLKEWAGIYNVRSFISDDPVQFPHRFTEKRDIEISAFITSWISYGRRELILRKADWLHSRMGGSPYEWVLSGRYWELVSDVPAGKRDTFYRFYTHSDLCALCDRLKEIYQRYDSLEDALAASSYPNPVFKLQDLFSGINGIPVMGGTSACKRLAMFLRWMVRTVEEPVRSSKTNARIAVEPDLPQAERRSRYLFRQVSTMDRASVFVKKENREPMADREAICW